MEQLKNPEKNQKKIDWYLKEKKIEEVELHSSSSKQHPPGFNDSVGPIKRKYTANYVSKHSPILRAISNVSSKKFPRSIRRSNISDRVKEMCGIWKRLDVRYGRLAMKEYALKNKLNRFPMLSIKHPKCSTTCLTF